MTLELPNFVRDLTAQGMPVTSACAITHRGGVRVEAHLMGWPSLSHEVNCWVARTGKERIKIAQKDLLRKYLEL